AEQTRFAEPGDRFSVAHQQSDRCVLRIEVTAVNAGEATAPSHHCSEIVFAVWVVDHTYGGRPRREERKIEGGPPAHVGLLQNDPPMFESGGRTFLSFGRADRPSRGHRTGEHKKKNDG